MSPVSPSRPTPSPRTFNDDSPLGIRRILSQSTDSLNMRNRTLSVESLIDEGGDTAGGREDAGEGHGEPVSHRCHLQALTSS